MKGKQHLRIFIIVAAVLACRCVDPYNPRTSKADVNYLVIDGFLNSQGQTTIKLSRTSPISGGDSAVAEANAQVHIIGDNGSDHTLAQSSAGVYEINFSPSLDPSIQYKLNIKTADQREYASDFVAVKLTPAIDSIGYSLTGEDLQMNVSTHDDNNNTHYYLWKYVETWEYHSRYTSQYVFDPAHDTMVARHNFTDIYYCWNTLNSTQIFAGSSAKLSEDKISDFPLQILNIHSVKFGMGYSLLVNQYALTEEAYDYWQQLKKSTETIGTIFDPQPSQGLTNIHCVSNPSEAVVGYFSAGSIQQKRIFVTKDDLTPVSYHDTGYERCTLDTLEIADIHSFNGDDLVFDAIVNRGGQIIGYAISQAQCIDCRLHGGSTVKPTFWP